MDEEATQDKGVSLECSDEEYVERALKAYIHVHGRAPLSVFRLKEKETDNNTAYKLLWESHDEDQEYM